MFISGISSRAAAIVRSMSARSGSGQFAIKVAGGAEILELITS